MKIGERVWHILAKMKKCCAGSSLLVALGDHQSGDQGPQSTQHPPPQPLEEEIPRVARTTPLRAGAHARGLGEPFNSAAMPSFYQPDVVGHHRRADGSTQDLSYADVANRSGTGTPRPAPTPSTRFRTSSPRTPSSRSASATQRTSCNVAKTDVEVMYFYHLTDGKIAEFWVLSNADFDYTALVLPVCRRPSRAAGEPRPPVAGSARRPVDRLWLQRAAGAVAADPLGDVAEHQQADERHERRQRAPLHDVDAQQPERVKRRAPTAR